MRGVSGRSLGLLRHDVHLVRSSADSNKSNYARDGWERRTDLYALIVRSMPKARLVRAANPRISAAFDISATSSGARGKRALTNFGLAKVPSARPAPWNTPSIQRGIPVRVL